jgi:type IV fimbrial biogenesis protein FimT
MMAALMVAGILFAIGAPAIRGVFTSNKMATHLNQLSTAISYARSEAIKRVTPVAVGAISGSWSNGWNVWIDDVTQDGVLDTSPAETILRTGSSTASTISLTGTTTVIVYQPNGSIQVPDGTATSIPAAPVSFTLCYSGQTPRILTLSTTGLPQITKGTTACP